MNLKEEISLDKVFEKQGKIKLFDQEDYKEAILTHFLHNNKNGFQSFIKMMQ